MKDALLSSGNDEWSTPPYLFHRMDAEFGPFTVDAAASSENALCSRFWTPREDGARQSWAGERVWCNPPYSNGKQASFLLRAARCEADVAVLLIPSRTDTRAWHEAVMAKASEIRFIMGRLTFSGAEHPAPFPSALAIFRKGGERSEPICSSWRVEPGLYNEGAAG